MLSVSDDDIDVDLDITKHLEDNVPSEESGNLNVFQILDPSCLDYRHPFVRARPDLLATVLEEKYHSDFIYDAQQTGHLVIRDGKPFLRTNLGLAQFSGLVLEAYVVRHLVKNHNALRSAIAWCSRAAGMYPNQSFIQQWLPIETGLQDTKSSYRHWFNTNDPRLDIMFLKKYLRGHAEQTHTLPRLSHLLWKEQQLQQEFK